MKKYRGAHRFSLQHLAATLGFAGEIVGIEIKPDGDDVIFWCRHEQDEMVVAEGQPAPILTRNGQ